MGGNGAKNAGKPLCQRVPGRSRFDGNGRESRERERNGNGWERIPARLSAGFGSDMCGRNQATLAIFYATGFHQVIHQTFQFGARQRLQRPPT